ncbi:H-NS family nucleoid-associated regulatory protein [Phaeobacter sp. SYSU ZJ3003]|uniref:H-NS histone family protein n=1 Tax=Phaeobacter sp. SYSU ZJ3003 TaxID=2109330 RepID=UPI00351C6C42
MTVNLEDMSLEELKSLQKDIEKAIDTYEQRQKAEARKELEEHAKALGFKLEELVSDKSTKPKKPVPPKYQHPENPSLTWSGRGRKPKFVLEHLDNGGSLDDLLIK